MEKSSKRDESNSVRIGGSVTGGIIQAGDKNSASLRYQVVTLPSPESIDIGAELKTLQEKLTQLDCDHKKNIHNALEEAKEELAKQKPEKDEVGKALDRALDYAKKAKGFANIVETLRPPIMRAASWLGENWHKILAVVGLAVK